MKAAPFSGLGWLLCALLCLAAGATLALNHPLLDHPLWPLAVLAAFLLWCGVSARFEYLWLFAVPACLPFLNFAPWTGWVVFEEFDLLLLGTLAGGYGRCAWRALAHNRVPMAQAWTVADIGVLALGLSGLVALAVGVMDAGGFRWDWYASYEAPLNSLRVFKGLGFAVLFYPLATSAMQALPAANARLFISGVVAGLAVLTLAVVWERWTYVGLMDFSSYYRTVGLFWEMHVGGAAIDSYLALTAPFLAWALLTVRSRWLWAGLAVLAVLATYVCLTTFSRGVYLAVVGPLLLYGILLRRQRQGAAEVPMAARAHPGWLAWRTRAGLALAVVLVMEVAGVLGGGTFMAERLSQAQKDLGSRLTHWGNGLALLKSPADWMWGIGLGRIPSQYAAQTPGVGFSGQVNLKTGQGADLPRGQYVALQGPAADNLLTGIYGLTQRLPVAPAGELTVALDVRTQDVATLYMGVCERHLLYARDCQEAIAHLPDLAGQWHTLELPLEAVTPGKAGDYSAVFEISVDSPLGAVDVDNIRFLARAGEPVLSNSDFSQGLTAWFPQAQAYYVPWHIDNLYLEVLIERGVVGIVVGGLLMAIVLWHLVWGPARSGKNAPLWTASLAGILLVGAVSSVLDVPRVAFLFLLVAIMSAKEGLHGGGPESRELH